MVWMGSKANIAAITALDTTNFQNGIVFFSLAEKKALMLNKTSSETVNNETIWAATPSGRWGLVLSASGGSLVTVSSVEPTTIAVAGSVYIWKENTTGTYPADADGRYPNSVITYVSDGAAWVVTAARTIAYGNTPGNIGKLPKNIYERWLDTSTDIEYKASLNGSTALSWVIA